MATPLDHEVADRIRRRGPIPFDEVVDLALYDQAHGFYGTGAGAGRRADFLTSPEVGPLFGALVARGLDRWWEELGRPDPFVVVEAAAGIGTLARAVLLARPACVPALTYVLVERSAALRERHRDHLPIVDAALALPPTAADDPGARPDATGLGPRVVSLPDLPAVRLVGVVLANELLDNLAFGLLERRSDGWWEVRVGLDEEASALAGEPVLAEVAVPAADADDELARMLAPAAVPGARIPVQDRASGWVADALAIIDRGRLVVVDYAATTADLAARPQDEWVRTYRAHGRGGPPLASLGTQDITVEVAVDQVGRARRPDRVTDQAGLLRELGVDELVAEGLRTWEDRAHVGDLDAIRARSRIGEAEALTDPAGLGGFAVLAWTVR